MTIDLFHALQTDTGRQLLARLAQAPLTDDALLPAVERLRKDFPAELVGAAVELTRLRQRAASKFSAAARMFFTRERLEMASAEPVARHTARRFAGLPRVWDLCGGIGGDTLALAEVADYVMLVESDPLALAMARANADALGLAGHIDFRRADVTEMPLPDAPLSAIFIDPARRNDAGRHSRRGDAYAPPLAWCLGLTRLAPRVAVKVSPALDFAAALANVPAEVEVISLRGECKEAVLWLGDWRGCARRATVLPGDATLTDDGPSSPAISDFGAWLFEPDPAVIRAGLVQRLAGELGLRRIDPEIAYLTGDQPGESPFAAGYAVREVIPWSLKRLNAALAARHIGHVTIKKRGFPLTPEALHPKLKLKGPNSATLICTRMQGHAYVVIAE